MERSGIYQCSGRSCSTFPGVVEVAPTSDAMSFVVAEPTRGVDRIADFRQVRDGVVLKGPQSHGCVAVRVQRGDARLACDDVGDAVAAGVGGVGGRVGVGKPGEFLIHDLIARAIKDRPDWS